MTSKKNQTTKPPPADDPPVGQPKLTVSLFGLFKVDGHGAMGVRAASFIALALCGLVILKMGLALCGR